MDFTVTTPLQIALQAAGDDNAGRLALPRPPSSLLHARSSCALQGALRSGGGAPILGTSHGLG